MVRFVLIRIITGICLLFVLAITVVPVALSYRLTRDTGVLRHPGGAVEGAAA